MSRMSTSLDLLLAKMRPGWNKKCTEAIEEAKDARRRYRAFRDDATRKIWRAKDNYEKKILREALADDHREKFSRTGEDTGELWKLHKWMKNRGALRTPFLPWIRDGKGEDVAV